MTEPAALGSLTLGVRLKTTGSMNSPGETTTVADVASCALVVSAASGPNSVSPLPATLAVLTCVSEFKNGEILSERKLLILGRCQPVDLTL